MTPQHRAVLDLRKGSRTTPRDVKHRPRSTEKRQALKDQG